MKWPISYRSVALVGTDGSGKSTQAELLRRLLMSAPRRARVFAVHPYGRKLLRVGSNSPVLPTSRPGKKPGILQRVTALADIADVALYLWLVHARASLAAVSDTREVWLVSDRSLDDVLIKHLRPGTISAHTADLVRRCVPGFGTTIWLRVEPQVAMVRDRDFAPGYYEEFFAAYAKASGPFGWRVIPESGRSPEAVLANVAGELGLSTPQQTWEDGRNFNPREVR